MIFFNLFLIYLFFFDSWIRAKFFYESYLIEYIFFLLLVFVFFFLSINKYSFVYIRFYRGSWKRQRINSMLFAKYVYCTTKMKEINKKVMNALRRIFDTQPSKMHTKKSLFFLSTLCRSSRFFLNLEKYSRHLWYIFELLRKAHTVLQVNVLRQLNWMKNKYNNHSDAIIIPTQFNYSKLHPI